MYRNDVFWIIYSRNPSNFICNDVTEEWVEFLSIIVVLERKWSEKTEINQ